MSGCLRLLRSLHRMMGRSVLTAGALLLLEMNGAAIAQHSQPIILEDFRLANDGFPQGWKAQRNEEKARQAYRIRIESGEAFLAAKDPDQRIYKRIAWDPKANPIVSWRWRLRSFSSGADPVAAIFISLDTDLMVIPVANKYVWSMNKQKGAMSGGGLFDASEIVIRSGPRPVGEWVEERVNAYEDFKRLHKHEPAAQAWGISLLAGTGVEIDFGSITVSPHDREQ